MVQKMFIMHFGAYLWFNCIRFGMTTHHSKVTHHFRSIPWMANSRKTLNENIFKRFDIAWTTACLDMTILRHNFYVIFVYGAIAALFLYSLWLNLFLIFFSSIFFFLNSVSVVDFFFSSSLITICLDCDTIHALYTTMNIESLKLNAIRNNKCLYELFTLILSQHIRYIFDDWLNDILYAICDVRHSTLNSHI